MKTHVRLRVAIVVASTVTIAGLVAAMYAGGGHSEKKPAEKALPTVKVSLALARQVSDTQDYVGRLEAVERVEVRPRVPGTIAAVHFKDGELVKHGTVLFTLDAAPYETRVQEAQASLTIADDRRKFTDGELVRARRLQTDNAISRKEFDAIENAAREAQSGFQAAQATLNRAKIDLGYTRIVAPISGRVSRAEITAGNVVEAGGAARPLTSIVTVDPIYAAFNVDERTFLRLAGSHMKGKEEPVSIALANESQSTRTGTIASFDNQLDAVSGTIRVRARVLNPAGDMVPGLQAKVRMSSSDAYQAVVIDETAIGTDQDKRFALVVGKDGKVSYRMLSIGGREGAKRVVREGVTAGEAVIVEGAQRVKAGDLVRAVPTDGPSDATKPDGARS